jgi:hypothetical protein
MDSLTWKVGSFPEDFSVNEVVEGGGRQAGRRFRKCGVI